MIPRWNLTIFGFALLLCSSYSNAQDFLQMQSNQEFPETMSELQNAITRRGYTISRIQKIDEGLRKHGYEKENYKVVFFGKAHEIRYLSDRYPELTPFLPLNFVVYVDKGRTSITTLNPTSLKFYYKSPQLHATLEKWEADLNQILAAVQQD